MLEDDTSLLDLTADIVSAYVANNQVATASLADLIRSVHGSLTGLNDPKPVAADKPPTPAVSIRRSITPDYVICLEDGLKFKSLTRHLRTAYNMTPEQYREKWALAADYPMVAPNYSAQRSRLAREFGLGQRRQEPESMPASPRAPSKGKRKKVS
ncbi:MucR family transcriptional regulator [Labrys sp. ZIDIC5]|uniref:MucR family transcriptional regulator n=1 Tax=Labrys sedimenti TaxID=3106036 RepID=UPI002ACAEC11|nr:MucR family transcriptional regulator [Labrys sp. ZIDIC5]MDZ5451198.1 MucR family transcriptional regulator [Labrys sp. ZIDIC5]